MSFNESYLVENFQTSWTFQCRLLRLRALLRFKSGISPALRIHISGHGSINITAESAFWRNGLWRRAFYVRRSLKGLPKPFERIFERKWNVLWTLFWTFFAMDKSCVPVAKLAVSEKEVLKLWTKYLLSLVLAVSYQVWACFINNSSRLSLASVGCGSFGFHM